MALRPLKVLEVDVAVPDGVQIIVGQAHFIKTVEDIYETLAAAMPGLKFGLAFCEASGKALVRYEGTDGALTDLATKYASMIGAGHSFVVLLKDAFPINVLNRIKAVEEVVGIYCATSNPISVVIADSGKGRGIMGVIDGIPPKGAEGELEKEERRSFLRKVGYKR